jgi:hypothetical protein
MRALIYLALPSVGFAWLLQVDLPRVPYAIDAGFIVDAGPDYLGRALVMLGLAAVAVAVAFAIALLFGVRPTDSKRSSFGGRSRL